MIIVLGNCQAAAWSATLRLIFPETEVRVIPADALLDPNRIESVHALVRQADHVFSLPWEEHYGLFSETRIRDLTPNLILIPSFDFNGFHPDLSYLFRKDGSIVCGPLFHYHSLLGAAAFLRGKTVAQTVRLFNALTYSRLGYFDFFASAERWVTDRFALYGYDIETLFARWRKRGAFMMTVNHPRNFVTADLIAAVCRIRGLGQVHDVDYGSLFPDGLADAPIFPVYPEVGQRLGLPGNYLFKPPARGDYGTLLDLPTFVARSFENYAAEDTAHWDIPPLLARAIELIDGAKAPATSAP